jgi:ribosomal-protein-alanine N-acetyltransferase
MTTMAEEELTIPIDIRLESERCALRYPDQEDIDEIYAALSSPAFPRQLPLGQIRSRQGVANWIRNCQGGWRNGTSFSWTIERRSDGRLLGQVTLARMDQSGTWALAFWIAPQSWGQGYATEAASRLMAYWFQELGAEKIWAGAGLWNESSVRVLEKLGMRYVKENPEGYQIEGEFIPTKEFEITFPMWSDLKAEGSP